MESTNIKNNADERDIATQQIIAAIDEHLSSAPSNESSDLIRIIYDGNRLLLHLSKTQALPDRRILHHCMQLAIASSYCNKNNNLFKHAILSFAIEVKGDLRSHNSGANTGNGS